jgi:hypothetical protein
MAKLLPNRISETMSDAQLKQFREGIRLAAEALPKKPVMSKEDFDKIPKKAESRSKEANLRIKVVRKFPKFLPPTLSVQDVDNDNVLHEQISALRTDVLMPLMEVADFMLGLSGGEELNAYSRFADNMRKAKDEGDPEAIEAFNDWDAVDRQLNIGSYKKAPADPNTKPPTTPTGK